MGWTDTSVCLTQPGYTQSPNELVDALRDEGVTRAWIFGYGAVQSHDFLAANALVADAAQRFPDALVPLAVVNPFNAEREIEGLIKRGFRGVKILTDWGNWLTIDNIRRTVVPLAKTLAAHRLHLSFALEGNVPLRGGSVYLPLLVREACPEISLLLDRCWTPQAWLDYLTIADEDKTLWFTVQDLPPKLLRQVIDRLGLSRIVLGSWHPDQSPKHLFEKLNTLTDTDAVKLGAILTANADTILAGQHPAP